MAYTIINKSTDYFDTKLHDGTGVAKTLAYDFEVDMYWTKMRNDVYPHMIFDAVRGNNNRIRPNQTNGEGSAANTVSFGNSSGISLGTDSGSYGVNKAQNDSSQTAQYVGWGWKANGAGSSNTDGSTTSTVSVNTTAGFSIVKYAGADAVRTVGHGLGVKPNMIIVKRLGATAPWQVYHSSLGATKYLSLNETTAATTSSARWNDTEPTSSVFTLSTSAHVNESGDYIAYCFADVTGYSKFGSYVGNANADGTFVYTGFKPAFVIAKLTSVAGENWYMWDNKRSTGNVMDKFLYPNLSNAEVGSSSFIDFLSNGFKLRSSSDVLNGSGNTHIYMAFGQSIVGSNNIPATAR